jgi:predicted TIM-barrel fold metal-dependent hydrolase
MRMLIVDSQVHIWKAETKERPWTPGLKAQLPEPLSIELLREEMQGAGVHRVIIVPPHWEGLRNDYAMEAVARYPDQFRFMGRLNLERPDAPEQLANWMQMPGNLGMRQSFLTQQERAKLGAGEYDWLFAGCERYGIPLMVHAADLRPTLERVLSLYPGLRLILDHMGLSGTIVKEGRLEEAARNTAALARYPNVATKLSSAPLHSHEAYPFTNMHGYIRQILEAFGPQRCFWGSDLSHMLHACSYSEGVELFTKALNLPEAVLEEIMGRALCRYLGWDMPD